MAGWPIREGLIALINHRRLQTLESHRQKELLWQIAAPYQKKGKRPPRVPTILRDQNEDD